MKTDFCILWYNESMPEIFSSQSKKKNRVIDVEESGNGKTMAEINMKSDTKTKKKIGPGRHVDEYSRVMSQETPSGNPFKAFAAKPTKTSFEAQHDEERILLLLRKHPVTQVHWILVAVALVFVPYLLSFVGFLSFLPANFRHIMGVGWYLMVVGYSLESFLNWFYNVYIITDERVIDVDFNSLLFKNVSYAKIENIEDISATTSGALGAIFDYGSVRIQTAGTVTEFEFENVPQPARITAFLNELIVEEEREKLEGRVN